MKIVRILLMAVFVLVASRMMSELPMCLGAFLENCGYGLIVIIPFLISTYFIDSLAVVLTETEEDVEVNKKRIINSVFCSPYIIFAGFVVVNFITSMSLVTVEYVFALETLLAVFIYMVFYILNSFRLVRKANVVFMGSFLITFLVFFLI